MLFYPSNTVWGLVRRINLFLICRFGGLRLMLCCSIILAQADDELLKAIASIFDLRQESVI
jgi:hypothetical protein